MKAQAIWIAVLAIAGALILRDLFPKTVTVASPPRITTVHDTVRVVDTAWVTKLRRDTIRVNVVERVTVTVPEMVFVVPPLRGITGVTVAPKVGDSTLVAGFALSPLDTGYALNAWTARFYTLGPLKSLVIDPAVTAPRIDFYDPPAPPCGFLCSAKKYAIGGLVGFGSCKLGQIGN